MLVINKRRKMFLNMETVYFSEHYADYKTDADIVLFYLSAESIPGSRAFHTLRIDLSKSEEELFSEVSATTRSKIRQAAKAGSYLIHMDENPSREKIYEFCDSYDEFAKVKGIKGADRELLLMAKDSNALFISQLKDRDGKDLCGTADIHDSKIVLGMYSYSHFRKFSDHAMRNQVSNANRLLYWELIRYHKQCGLKILDMGGLGMGKESKDLNTVDEFKRSFGGKIETLYHFYYPKSLLGKLVIGLTGKNKKIEY